MKILIGAIALVIAAPAFAQAVPADPHAGHAQHQQQGKAGHDQQQGGHSEHKMDCCKGGKPGECCAKMKQQGKTMACCDKAKQGDHKDHGA